MKLIPILTGWTGKHFTRRMNPSIIWGRPAVVQSSVICSGYTGFCRNFHGITRTVCFCTGGNVYCAAVIAGSCPCARLRFAGGGNNNIGFSAFPCDVQLAVLGCDFYIGNSIVVVVPSRCALALRTVCGNCFQYDGQAARFFLSAIYNRVKVDYIAGVCIGLVRRHDNGIYNSFIGFCNSCFHIFNVKNLIVSTAEENLLAVFHRIDIVLFYLVIGSHIPRDNHFAGIIRLVDRKVGRRCWNDRLTGGVLHLADVDLIIRRFAVYNQTKGCDFLARICGKVNRGSYPLLALGRRVCNIEFYNRIRIILKDNT